MTVQEIVTRMAPADVIARAKRMFAGSNSPQSAFVDQESSHHIRLQLDTGEIMIGIVPEGEAWRVRASGSRGVALLSHFLAMIARTDGAPLPARVRAGSVEAAGG